MGDTDSGVLATARDRYVLVHSKSIFLSELFRCALSLVITVVSTSLIQLSAPRYGDAPPLRSFLRVLKPCQQEAEHPRAPTIQWRSVHYGMLRCETCIEPGCLTPFTLNGCFAVVLVTFLMSGRQGTRERVLIGGPSKVTNDHMNGM